MMKIVGNEGALVSLSCFSHHKNKNRNKIPRETDRPFIPFLLSRSGSTQQRTPLLMFFFPQIKK